MSERGMARLRTKICTQWVLIRVSDIDMGQSETGASGISQPDSYISEEDLLKIKGKLPAIEAEAGVGVKAEGKDSKNDTSVKAELISKKDTGNNEEDDDDLVASQRIPVATQYCILFQDGCYVFMFLAGSQIFGILGAVGGSLVEEVVIWGGSEVERRFQPRISAQYWQPSRS